MYRYFKDNKNSFEKNKKINLQKIMCFCKQLPSTCHFSGNFCKLMFMEFISIKISFFFFCLFALFLGLLPWHMEVPRLGVESEL